MRPEPHDAAYLWDMLAHAREAVEFVRGRTFEEYMRDGLRRRAVERVVEIVGEAASKVSAEFRAATPNVRWRAIIVQRHRLIHEYGGIDHEKIWRVAVHHAPLLIPQLERLLPPPPPDPHPEPVDPAAA